AHQSGWRSPEPCPQTSAASTADSVGDSVADQAAASSASGQRRLRAAARQSAKVSRHACRCAWKTLPDGRGKALSERPESRTRPVLTPGNISLVLHELGLVTPFRHRGKSSFRPMSCGTNLFKFSLDVRNLRLGSVTSPGLPVFATMRADLRRSAWTVMWMM